MRRCSCRVADDGQRSQRASGGSQRSSSLKTKQCHGTTESVLRRDCRPLSFQYDMITKKLRRPFCATQFNSKRQVTHHRSGPGLAQAESMHQLPLGLLLLQPGSYLQDRHRSSIRLQACIQFDSKAMVFSGNNSLCTNLNKPLLQCGTHCTTCSHSSCFPAFVGQIWAL